MVATRSKRSTTDRSYSFTDQVALLWFLVDGITHFVLEGSYLYYAFNGGAKTHEGLLPWIWKEYSKADRRWEVSDGGVMAIEALTVLAVGPLCFVLLYAIWYRKAYRHFLQTCICVAELYGGAMTFFPEWLTGSPNLVTDSFKLKWFYLAFMNGVWVLIPAILLWESARKIIAACDKSKTELHDQDGISPIWHALCVGTLIVYSISVPAVVVFTR